MIINVKIDNLKGIRREIEISTLALNKIKRNENQTSKLDEKNKLLKSTCLIGCNGSGKTSFINGIMAIKSFISFPFRKSFKDSNNFIEQIKSFPEEVIKDILRDLNTLKLPEQNASRKKESTIIEISAFIPKRKDNISGIYTYKIEYNNEFAKNGVLLEKLVYRKDYDAKKELVIFNVSNNIESELGTTILYENNIIKNYDDKNEIKDKIKYYKSFGKEIMDYLGFCLSDDSFDLNSSYNSNKERFLGLCNLADDKIVNVTIKKDVKNKNEFLQFWIDDNNYLIFNQLSEGTRKVIIVGNTILDAMKNNSTLIIDEIESSLHPQLARLLVELIGTNSSNNYAQLIFTTHSPLLAFTLKDDQIIYINDHDGNYEFNSINRAISNNIISKDKNPNKAWLEGLLIKHPDENKIAQFVEKYQNTSD